MRYGGVVHMRSVALDRSALERQRPITSADSIYSRIPKDSIKTDIRSGYTVATVTMARPKGSAVTQQRPLVYK